MHRILAEIFLHHFTFSATPDFDPFELEKCIQTVFVENTVFRMVHINSQLLLNICACNCFVIMCNEMFCASLGIWSPVTRCTMWCYSWWHMTWLGFGFSNCCFRLSLARSLTKCSITLWPLINMWENKSAYAKFTLIRCRSALYNRKMHIY